MKLVFGLGNPGSKYQYSRHNFGYRVIDGISKKLGIPLKKRSSYSFCGQGEFNSTQFILAKPLTFMNRSGEALGLLVQKFNICLEDLLVVYDDIDLPLGTIRFRKKGGPGTHRGMISCVECLGSSDFPRLRLGIMGDRGEKDLSQYVLENFTAHEEKVVEEVLGFAIKKILEEFLV